MEEKFNFIKMDQGEFETYISTLKVGRTVLTLLLHHTYSPDYSLFKGNNHFELQKAMRDFHIHSNGWADIGQHFTIFPDGMILTGRSMEQSPACIYGQNQQAVCIENLGNFDKGKDNMNMAQKDSIVNAVAFLCDKFSIPVNTDKIVYHHWFRLDNGTRNNGGGNNKTCPGSNFFGGNKVPDCERYFLPLVRNALKREEPKNLPLIKYAAVTATALNIRTKPNGSSPKANDRDPVLMGSILRVYGEKNGWFKISSSKNHWVYSVYTMPVTRAEVTASTLNIRNGPEGKALKVGSLLKGEEVFVYETQNGWSRIAMSNRWVSSTYLNENVSI